MRAEVCVFRTSRQTKDKKRHSEQRQPFLGTDENVAVQIQ